MAWVERYVSVAGAGLHDGTSEANAWTLAECIAAPYAAGQRINVKAGTYANTTTSLTFGVAGTTTAPIWFRGYNTTIGDLDSSHALALPAITFTTGNFIISGAYHLFTNLDISGAQTTSAQVRMLTTGYQFLDRCRVECTSANANGRAVTLSFTNQSVSRCFLKANAAADVVQMTSNATNLIGCSVVNGADGVSIEGSAYAVVMFNTFRDQAANGIVNNNGGQKTIVGNSIYSPVGDGIKFETVIPSLAVIVNNILSECGGYGINNALGTNSSNFVREHNRFYTNTSGNENGFGDWPSIAEQAGGSNPFTSATDLKLVNGDLAIAAGLPGLFENEAYTSFLDIGAVQREEPAGGGGMLVHPGMSGGMRG